MNQFLSVSHLTLFFSSVLKLEKPNVSVLRDDVLRSLLTVSDIHFFLFKRACVGTCGLNYDVI